MSAHPGFVGSCEITTTSKSGIWPGGGSISGTSVGLFLTGGSLNPVQEINAPELIQGQVVKHIFNYGKVEIGGNIQAPIDEHHKAVFDAAWYRKSSDTPDHMACEDIVVKISYYRSSGKNARVFNNLAIASYEVSVTAGDVASFTCEFMGASNFVDGSLVPALTTENYNSPAVCSKLVTWDRCMFQLTGKLIAVQSFTFSVNNNLQRVYKVKSNDLALENDPAATLYPVELVAGFRDVSGSVTALAGDAGAGDTPVEGAPEEQFAPAGWYDGSDVYGAENWGDYEAANMHAPVVFQVGTGMVTPIIDVTFEGVFKRPEASPKTDLQTYTLNYVGLCYDSL